MTVALSALQSELESVSADRRAYARLAAAVKARSSLLGFMRYVRPDPQDVDDADRSQYEITPLARLLAEILEKVERGELKRVCVSVGPQMGKSDLISRGFPAWYEGKNPSKHFMLGSYNQDFAEEFGGEVRDISTKASFRQVFPRFAFRQGSAAKDFMVTMDGGKMSFVGRGGSGTGKPSDLWVCDDALKDDKEAQSPAIRKELWNWFTKVVFTRCHSESAVVVVNCLTGDTRITMSDGAEKELREIRPGDVVATYDAGKLSTSTVTNWRSNGLDKVYEIKTTSGKIVKANERHPFLVYNDGKPEWIRTKNLRQGQEIFRVNGICGRESLARRSGVTRELLPEDIARRTTTKNDGAMASVLRLLSRTKSIISNGATCTLRRATESRWTTTNGFLMGKMASAPFADNHHWKMSRRGGEENCVLTTVTTQEKSEGFSATIATLSSGMQKLLGMLWPSPSTSDFTLDKIVSITPLGVEEVFDVEIKDTENFIANGLVSHNTRWSEDDLIGRLCDKTHPDHNPKISRDWTYINLPAVVKSPELATALGLTLQVPTDPDVIEQFGSVPMASIWEKKKSLSFLAEARRFDPKGFEALYMGNPAPEDGEYFKKEWLVPYKPEELPKNLMKYCGSDHAIDENSDSDKSCFITAGVDEKGIIWVMPNIYWERESDTSEIVDVMLEMMRSEKPLIWWAERENISKAILPFLRKRMIETGVMSTLIDDSAVPSKSKKARAKSIQGMMALQRVRFPTFMHWWPEAQNQLLKFDAGAHDDFVDALAWIGIGLMREVPASRAAPESDKIIRVGSIQWVKGQTRYQEREEVRRKSLRGM